jgi:hypothetical protein
MSRSKIRRFVPHLPFLRQGLRQRSNLFRRAPPSRAGLGLCRPCGAGFATLSEGTPDSFAEEGSTRSNTNTEGVCPKGGRLYLRNQLQSRALTKTLSCALMKN